MKTVNLINFFVVILSTILSFTSCKNDENIDVNNPTSYTGFDFSTTKQVTVEVKTLTNSNEPIKGAFVEFYTKNPFSGNGTLIENSADVLIFKGQTSETGLITAKIAPATTVDSLYLVVNHVGLQALQAVKLNSNDISVVFGGASSQNAKMSVGPLKAKTEGIWWVSNFWKVNDFYAFATWTNLGLPNNLEKTNDVITSDFLADVNASLPERFELPISHPEYFLSEDDGSIVLIEDAEVWVTFVHEGAGYTNTLAYYSYPTDNAPATKADIKYSTLIFPNVSYTNSGGDLKSGNKVQLLYFDKVKNQYTNIFPAGTSVAWVFRANGWNGSTVSTGYHTIYSNANFNPETDVNLKKHNVILKDDVRKLLLIGFEDMRRDNGSDNDFNDGVFYASVTPYTAVKGGIYENIDTPKDTDKDGVSDSRDDYPTDPLRAFNNYYPAKNQTGTLAFEDLWPNKGDYDFNDLVLDYNFNQVTNAKNEVVEVNANLTVKAIGALLKNQFALQFNTTAQNVSSVTGQSLTRNVFNMNSNGTEKGQATAVVPVFEDPFTVLGYDGTIVNTIVGGAFATPKTITLKVLFVQPIALANFGTAPYNPFIVIGGDRGREVHLPGGAPTQLADASLFGTGDDNTNVSLKKYYMSDKFLPWGINIPVKFDYPSEQQDITNAFLMFNNWANSRGYNYMDWYQDKPGYRDYSKLFK